MRRLGLLLALLLATLATGCGRRGDPIAPELTPLLAPTQVALSPVAGGVRLSWSAPEKTVGGRDGVAAGYVVERASLAEKTLAPATGCPTCPEGFAEIARIDGAAARAAHRPETQAIDTALASGRTYVYRVAALDPRGRRGLPSPALTLTWTAQGAPTVSATPLDGGARLAFAPGEAAPTGFALEGHRVADFTGKELAALPADATVGDVAGLANGVPADLTVVTVLRTPEGARIFSAPATVRVTPQDQTPPAPIDRLAAIAEEGGVSLHWLPGRGELPAAVVILRGVEGEPLTEIARVDGRALQYKDGNVTAGVRYRYVAVATDAAGNRSAPSPQSEARALEGKR